MKIIGTHVLFPWNSVAKSLTGVGPRKDKRKESGIRETEKSLKGFCYEGKVKNGGLVEENVFVFKARLITSYLDVVGKDLSERGS